MEKRNTRLRREYLYRKNLESKEFDLEESKKNKLFPVRNASWYTNLVFLPQYYFNTNYIPDFVERKSTSKRVEKESCCFGEVVLVMKLKKFCSHHHSSFILIQI
jgi:hypothetical protein